MPESTFTTDCLARLFSKSTYAISNVSISQDSSDCRFVRFHYGLTDLMDYSSRKFSKSVHVTMFGDLQTLLSAPVPVDERLRGSIPSPQDDLEFRVTEGSADKSQMFAEVWRFDEQLARCLIPNHKEVYFNGLLGSPIFVDESVLFVAEPNDTKYPRGYWAENKDQVPVGDKFKHRPDFGETMLKTRTPQLVLFNWVTKAFKTISLGDLKVHPAFPTPFGGVGSRSILFVGYSNESSLHTPGLSRCFNRGSKIYKISDVCSDTPEITCVTPDVYLALAPVVSDDGTGIVFAGRKEWFAPHCTEMDLFTITDIGARIIPVEKRRDDESVVPTYNGLCLSSQSESALMQFLPDNKTIIVPSFSSGKAGVFLVCTVSGKVVKSLFPPNVDKLSSVVLQTTKGYDCVFVHQGYTCTRSLWLAKIDPSNVQSVAYTQLFQTPDLFNVPGSSVLNGLRTATVSVIQSANCPAWVIQSGVERTGPRPLIAYLHGGPHMMAVSSFSVELASFLCHGYDIVVPNYRGSLSFGEPFLNALVGNAGIVDVQDCHDCVLMAKEMLKPSTVVAYGGSHGGFLTGWLLGHPDTKETYSCGVLWNPAVDLVSSNLTSDIPEWALAQVLTNAETESLFAPSVEFMVKAAKQSPMSVVKNVAVPALVLLGSNDKRVVPCGGLRWAQAVETNGGKVDVMWFPDQGHAIASPECNETAIVSIALWIDKQVKSGVC